MPKKIVMVQKKVGLPKAWQGKKPPTKIGDAIDLLLAVRTARKAVESEVESMKAEEAKLKEAIIQTLNKDNLDGAKGKHATVSLKPKEVPQMDPEAGGWEAIYSYIKKNDAFDLLHKRLGEEACRLRWEAGESIPGVKKFSSMELSITEVK